jgi:hypothetical protein
MCLKLSNTALPVGGGGGGGLVTTESGFIIGGGTGIGSFLHPAAQNTIKAMPNPIIRIE